MSQKYMEIPIVAVTTNEGDHLRNWLNTVSRLQVPSAEYKIIPCIVDNGSTDTTVGVIWKAIESGQVDRQNVFWLHQNIGCPAAQNFALRNLGSRSLYRYVAILNVDVLADANWLSELIIAAEEDAKISRIGMWASLILQPNYPTRISSAGHCLRARDGVCLDIDRDMELENDNAMSKRDGFEPFAPCFAASLWSFELIREVGLPDNYQFLYYDDIDLAYKARIFEWSAKFIPSSRAFHPIPQKKTEPDRVTAQIEGRLTMVAKYFPEAERQRILGSLTEYERDILSKIHSSRLKPFGSEDIRQGVFDCWGNRYLPIKML
jgi:GT2 family glycosyltransferase